MRAKFWMKDLMGGGPSEDPGIGEDDIKMDLEKSGFGVWTGTIWLTTETCVQALVNMVTNGSIQCGEILDKSNLSRTLFHGVSW